LEIYQGEGTSGIKLTEENVTFGPLTLRNGDFQKFTFTNPETITQGEKYTFCMVADAPTATIWVLTDDSNPYPLGRTGENATRDYLFQTFISQQDNVFARGWNWVTPNEPFDTFTDWAENQPSTADEDCLHYFIDQGVAGSWNDQNCLTSFLPYLVEFDGSFTDTDGDGVVDCLDECPNDASKSEDTAPPTIICPADFELTLEDGVAELGMVEPASISDDCDQGVSVTQQSPAAGTPLTGGVGSQTVVTLTTADAAGNQASCTVVVTLAQAISPIIASATWTECRRKNCLFFVANDASSAETVEITKLEVTWPLDRNGRQPVLEKFKLGKTTIWQGSRALSPTQITLSGSNEARQLLPNEEEEYKLVFDGD